ncbi:hypothetical protein RKLH11_1494 [Rhodobacteraceae bacterium KLH11]|nr:hypothetical protein RKLH11_1494 [Rhodobacteraceae bacterium KLH11]
MFDFSVTTLTQPPVKSDKAWAGRFILVADADTAERLLRQGDLN